MAVSSRRDLSFNLPHSVTTLAVFLCTGIGIVFPENTASCAENERRPNIVFILADDLGWSDLACYGADLNETPHLDQFAKESVRFTHAYASAPICSPTRAAILTGQYPARLGMTIWHEAAAKPPRDRKLVPPVVTGDLPHEHATLSQMLHDAGYVTGHIGKWHLGEASYFPETFGFDFHVAGNHWGAPPTYFYPYRGLFGDEKELRYVPGLPWGQPGEYLTDRLTQEAIRFIDRAGDRPFFLNLWHYSVHTPTEAKEPDIRYFERKLRPEMRHRNPVFAAMLKSLDANVARLLDALRARGLAENTVVIFTSDNGGFLGGPNRFITTNEPLRSGKGSLYEGGVRVPLIVRWPGVTPAGAVCDVPVASMDLPLTIREIVGLLDARANGTDLKSKEPPTTAARFNDPAIDGLSFAPLLKKPTATLERDTLYWHYPHYYSTSTPCSSIRKGDWKLIEFFEDNHVELYNLHDDPSEKTNLADKMREKAAELRQALAAWRTAVKAQMPTVNDKDKKTGA